MAGSFREALEAVNGGIPSRTDLEIIQVNVGNLCNQKCVHCHVDAGPDGKKIMCPDVMDDIVSFLSKKEGMMLDITGGCPELNPHIRYLIEKARPFARKIAVRNNLTIFLDERAEGVADFYRKNKVKLICSMPCYTKENVDGQRGGGVFDKSVEALKMLNRLGYGSKKDLGMDLVYNPGGAFLPGNQDVLEKDYKKALGDNYGIRFNNLLTITNAPIKRFGKYLKENGSFDKYMRLLKGSFNSAVAGSIMCRNLLSIGWDGTLYDCDFNQALGLAIKDAAGNFLNIRGVDPADLKGHGIIFEDHCYSCTAGTGSSCSGSLGREKGK